MAFKFWQLDFAARPIESVAKAVFFWVVVVPFFGGLIWGVYDPRSFAGVLGAVFGRATQGAIKETKPEVQNLLGARKAFDLGGNPSLPPARR